MRLLATFGAHGVLVSRAYSMRGSAGGGAVAASFGDVLNVGDDNYDGHKKPNALFLAVTDLTLDDVNAQLVTAIAAEVYDRAAEHLIAQRERETAASRAGVFEEERARLEESRARLPRRARPKRARARS